MLLCLPLSGGTTYYIVVDGYSGDAGSYQFYMDPSYWNVGGEVVASATEISSLPFLGFGFTCPWANNYDETCPYSGSTSQDVVYAYSPLWSEHVDIDLCLSQFDTKLYVYEDAVTPGDPYACNDDYYFDGECGVYASAIMNLELRGGHTYYIVVDGYDGYCGYYMLHMDSYDPVYEVVVNASGAGLYPTIQDGVWAVADGGTVWLGDGDFSGPGNNAIYGTGREITVRSQSGDPEACRINCNTLAAPSYPMKPGASGSLGRRGPIREFPDGRSLPRGNWGLVFWDGETSATVLQDVGFMNATETALYVWFSSPTIRNCVFIGNGGMDAGGISLWVSESQIENCYFEQNIGNRGGGIFALECALDIDECRFVQNLAFDRGGGIYLSPTSAANQDTRIRNSLFAQNTSNLGGGLFQDVAFPGAEVFIQNCTFAENVAGVGSAIALQSGDMKLWMSLIAFNSGGIGVECDVPGTLDVACTNIFGQPAGDWADCLAPFAGIDHNMWLNPEFCCILGTGIYTLQSDSPCAPANNPCGLLVGCDNVNCGESNTALTTWGDLKRLY
jgi:hypothetical protein